MELSLHPREVKINCGRYAALTRRAKFYPAQAEGFLYQEGSRMLNLKRQPMLRSTPCSPINNI
jgi:hypothetical protein